MCPMCLLRAWHIFFQRAKLHAPAYGWLVAKLKSRISCGGGTATAFPSWILWEKSERQSRHHLYTLPEQIQCLELQQLNRTGTFSTWALRPWSWGGSSPATTWLLALTLYPIYSHAHQPLFQHGLPLGQKYSTETEGQLPPFSTRLQLLGNYSLSTAAASSEFVRPTEADRWLWRG